MSKIITLTLIVSYCINWKNDKQQKTYNNFHSFDNRKQYCNVINIE